MWEEFQLHVITFHNTRSYFFLSFINLFFWDFNIIFLNRLLTTYEYLSKVNDFTKGLIKCCIRESINYVNKANINDKELPSESIFDLVFLLQGWCWAFLFWCWCRITLHKKQDVIHSDLWPRELAYRSK